MNSSQNNNIDTIKTLQETYPDLQFHFETIQYIGSISAFFITCTDETMLERNWEKVASSIAVYYQSKLKDDFERWNLYIFYLVRTNISRSLKYKIENHPISSRKIVVESFTDDISYDNLVSEHLTNTDLKLLSREELIASKSKVFEKDKTINSILEAADTSGRNIGDDYYAEILDNLEKMIK